MAKIGKATDNEYYELWISYVESFSKDVIAATNETAQEQLVRISRLEKDPEAWFKYYFPNFCTAEPAGFHIAATKRIIRNPEWYEVRAWSRELAKSARSMMEFIYLAMMGQLHNILLVSNTGGNAMKLLAPFKAFFEYNQRLIQDYGKQQNIGHWKAEAFIIKKGCSFTAIGWGESPRGARNEEKRPDGILIDDIDTDEECRNEEIMKNKIKWIEQALIGTRSISESLRILVNGNIIADNCAVKALGEKADKFEIINIRDKNGKSSWGKNSEKNIDRALSIISYESSQKEYFNNPMDSGDTFSSLKDGDVPNLRSCKVLIYADPATSNKDRTSGSDKAIGIIAKKGLDYYIVKAACSTMSNAKFIETLFDFYLYTRIKKVDICKVFIENNSLQDPFYRQVFLPLIYQYNKKTNLQLPITPDGRKKPEKWFRIEGTLEPINRLGHLIFNKKEENDPGMKILKAQFKSASRKQKKLDGPDMVEGGIFILKEKEQIHMIDSIEIIERDKKQF